jgi:hypothetical protein
MAGRNIPDSLINGLQNRSRVYNQYNSTKTMWTICPLLANELHGQFGKTFKMKQKVMVTLFVPRAQYVDKV